MQLTITNKLTIEDTKKIEEFLLSNNSIFNPLFSSPLWAERLKESLDFNFEYFIVEYNGQIIALHLLFRAYRGYAKINKLPIFIKDIAKLCVKTFYNYINWGNFIVFKNNIEEVEKEEAKKLIYNSINNKKYRIQKSPIYDEDIKFFKTKNILPWGTYIINIEDKTYEDIYKNFKRQARKAIEKTVEQDVYVKTLVFSELENYAKWISENQKETGKSYKVNIEDMKKEFKIFEKTNYIYEIFIAYQNNTILGSIGIWGFGNYISEFGVYQSKYAREHKLYVQDVIKDKIVKYMIERNIKYYDLAGFNPNEELTSKEKAIKQFKEKFRGEEVIYTTIEDEK